jgi:hypothetical protein
LVGAQASEVVIEEAADILEVFSAIATEHGATLA